MDTPDWVYFCIFAPIIAFFIVGFVTTVGVMLAIRWFRAGRKNKKGDDKKDEE